jgi:mannose-1-phosphate guanylyltransferase
MYQNQKARLWAIILAGGQGRRLQPLVRALYDKPLPKQFAVLQGDRSLLQETVQRMLPVVPPSRMVVVVSREHEEVARAQLAEHDGIDIIAQPKDLGTAPGILLPLIRILARDPEATVTVVPSDHHVPKPGPMLNALATAARMAQDAASPLTLLGVCATRPETDYGWIVPGTPIKTNYGDDLCAVASFVEKPPHEVAQRLHREGALWNTFVTVGRGTVYWRLARHHLFEVTHHLERYARRIGTSDEVPALDHAYDRMRGANFSQALLEPARGLATLPVLGSGWSDWGSPERVLQSLEEASALSAILERIRARQAASDQANAAPAAWAT